MSIGDSSKTHWGGSGALKGATGLTDNFHFRKNLGRLGHKNSSSTMVGVLANFCHAQPH